MKSLDWLRLITVALLFGICIWAGRIVILAIPHGVHLYVTRQFGIWEAAADLFFLVTGVVLVGIEVYRIVKKVIDEEKRRGQ